MSEPKLISPMLDNFVMGAPISDHDGVRCCPAMARDSDNKYIVKILSVPASRVQLDALLLTGAYANEASALNYFRDLSDGVKEEVDILGKLAKLEGFIPYEDCQIVPMENEVGYDVYLLSPYKRSLERFFQKNTMTQLGAVNLGLDMCAALAVCRQAGYLYVDLKPGNIFLTADQEYRIGDLGFVKLDSLKYASLPDKYRSAYTAPEISDAFSAINTTVDVYAAGLILYQVYNGGVLPFDGQAPAEELPAPIYADYEMAEIILKACAPDPAQRWQDPIQMGQALISYMQRNGVNDTPIVPTPVEEPETPAAEESMLEQTVAEETADGQFLLDAFADEVTVEQGSEEDIALDRTDEPPLSETDDPDNLSFLDDTSDETAPSEETVDEILYEDLPGDVSDILAQADNLIAHKAPEPVVVPDPSPVPSPDPVIPEESSNETVAEAQPAEKETPEEATEQDNIAEDIEAECDDTYEQEEVVSEKFSGKKILAIILALLLLAGLAFGGYIYYRDYYLQTVTSLTLVGNEDQLKVSVTTDVDESLLRVVCIDTYGNKLTEPVENGVATFTGLNPNTLYSVKVEVSGLRKLTGETSDSYSTPMQTSIVSLNAVTGSEDGSAIISFAVDGTDADSWTVNYTAEGEELLSQTFTGHMATITGLTLGKTYTFTLDSDSDLFLTGNTEINYTAVSPVFAENLVISGGTDGSIEVSWNTPEGITVGSWIVRCYNDSNYNQTITTTETTAVFTGLDTSLAHTVEVTAEGMSSSARSYLTANAVTATGATADVTSPTAITVTWNCEKAIDKWLVLYSIEGSAQQEVVRTATTSAVISPIVPGATYSISIQLEDGSTVLGGKLTTAVPEALAFDGQALGYIVKDTPMEFSMCLKPGMENWSYSDVASYTNSFTVGQRAAFVVHIPGQYNTPDDIITTLYVIRNESGAIISCASTASAWRDMWYRRYCELDVPAIPDTPGTYTIEVYFNGMAAHNQTFTVTE